MTIRVELGPEMEAILAAEARAQGLPLEQVAEQLLREALKERSPGGNQLSIQDFREMLSATREGSERLPDLPTASFSRDTFYEDRLDGGNAIPGR